MVKRTVLICDICGTQVQLVHTCAVCKADICFKCAQPIAKMWMCKAHLAETVQPRLEKILEQITAKMDSRISYNSPMDQFHWQGYLMLTEWAPDRKQLQHIQVRDIELMTQKAHIVAGMRERGRYIIDKYKDRRSS